MSNEDISRLERRIVALEDRVRELERKPVSTELAVQEKKTPRTRGTRLPEGYVPRNDTIEKMADELSVKQTALGVEHRRFCDYFYSAPGQKGVKVDWDRAWCNWMRNASERGQLGVTSTPRPARRTNDDKIQELMDLEMPGA